MKMMPTCADPENFLGGGGGGGVQTPKRGLTENFNMAKNNNLAVPGGGVRTPCPPSGFAHGRYISFIFYRRNSTFHKSVRLHLTTGKHDRSAYTNIRVTKDNSKMHGNKALPFFARTGK